MYKVLLVDDEPLARYGLKETIDWSAYNFKVVGEADNGILAIEKCKELEPDVVITDIYMEPIDGLTLIERLRGYNQDLEFIVISGYSDFNYAQKALKYSVTTYLLKPIEDDDLIAALITLKNKLDAKRKTNKIITEYRNRQNETYLRELLTSGESFEQLFEQACLNGLNFPLSNYIVINMEIDGLSKKPNNQEELVSTLVKITKYYIGLDKRYILSTLLGNNNVILIVFENAYKKTDSERLVKNIMSDFSFQSSQTLTVGLSGIVHKANMLPRAFKQANKALQRKALLGKNRMIYYTDELDASIPETVPFFSLQQTEELIEAIVLDHRKHVTNTINTYFNHLQEVNPINFDEIKNTIINLSVYIIQRLIKTPEMMQIIFNRIVQPAMELWHMETIGEINLWLSNFIDTLMNNTQVKEFSTYSILVQNAIMYIMSNYASSCDINLVAKCFYVSAGHLMRQFKQETGKTFLEYLTEYRISISITLLKSNHYRVYEVGEMVGFANAKYFSKIFKKITGKNPKDFLS